MKATRQWLDKVVEKAYSPENIRRISRQNGWLLLLSWPVISLIGIGKGFEEGGWSVLLAFSLSFFWGAGAIWAIRRGKR